MSPKSPEPDFRDLLMGQVDALIATRTVVKRPHRDLRTRVQLSAAPLIFKAARNRGMSVSQYLRRAVTAFTAFDLGIDMAQMLDEEPATRLKSDAPFVNREDGGRGGGPWKIRGLE